MGGSAGVLNLLLDCNSAEMMGNSFTATLDTYGFFK